MSCRLLTTSQAATYLSVSKAFLERDRWAGATIPFVRIGNRTVRYKRTDLDEYIELRRAESIEARCAIDP